MVQSSKVRVNGRIISTSASQARRQQFDRRIEEAQRVKALRQQRVTEAKRLDSEFRRINFGGNLNNFSEELRKIPIQIRQFMNVNLQTARAELDNRRQDIQTELNRLKQERKGLNKFQRKVNDAQRRALREGQDKLREGNFVTVSQIKTFGTSVRDTEAKIQRARRKRTSAAQKALQRTLDVRRKTFNVTVSLDTSGSLITRTFTQAGKTTTTFTNRRTGRSVQVSGRKSFSSLSSGNRTKLANKKGQPKVGRTKQTTKVELTAAEAKSISSKKVIDKIKKETGVDLSKVDIDFKVVSPTKVSDFIKADQKKFKDRTKQLGVNTKDLLNVFGAKGDTTSQQLQSVKNQLFGEQTYRRLLKVQRAAQKEGLSMKAVFAGLGNLPFAGAVFGQELVIAAIALLKPSTYVELSKLTSADIKRAGANFGTKFSQGDPKALEEFIFTFAAGTKGVPIRSLKFIKVPKVKQALTRLRNNLKVERQIAQEKVRLAKRAGDIQAQKDFKKLVDEATGEIKAIETGNYKGISPRAVRKFDKKLRLRNEVAVRKLFASSTKKISITPDRVTVIKQNKKKILSKIDDINKVLFKDTKGVIKVNKVDKQFLQKKRSFYYALLKESGDKLPKGAVPRKKKPTSIEIKRFFTGKTNVFSDVSLTNRVKKVSKKKVKIAPPLRVLKPLDTENLVVINKRIKVLDKQITFLRGRKVKKTKTERKLIEKLTKELKRLQKKAKEIFDANRSKIIKKAKELLIKSNKFFLEQKRGFKTRVLSNEQISAILLKPKGKAVLQARIKNIQTQLQKFKTNIIILKTNAKELVSKADKKRAGKLIGQLVGVQRTLERSLKNIRSRSTGKKVDQELFSKRVALEEAKIQKKKKTIIVKGNVIEARLGDYILAIEFLGKPIVPLRKAKRGAILARPTLKVTIKKSPRTSTNRVDNFFKDKVTRALRKDRYLNSARGFKDKFQDVSRKAKQLDKRATTQVQKRKFKDLQKKAEKQIKVIEQSLKFRSLFLFAQAFKFKTKQQFKDLQVFKKAFVQLNKTILAQEKILIIEKLKKPPGKTTRRPRPKVPTKPKLPTPKKPPVRRIRRPPVKPTKKPPVKKLKRLPTFRSSLPKGEKLAFGFRFRERRFVTKPTGKKNPVVVKRIDSKLPLNKAVRRYFGGVDKTLQRSGELFITGTTKSSDITSQKSLMNKFRTKKGKNILKFVEKRKFALDSIGEKKKIALSRLLKPKKRKK